MAVPMLGKVTQPKNISGSKIICRLKTSGSLLTQFAIKLMYSVYINSTSQELLLSLL